MKSFEYDVLGWGTPEGTYPGQFTTPVINIIKKRIAGCSRVLHLFSGSSTIGDVRVDLTHPAATHNEDVFEFVQNCDEVWDYTILDPPYEMSERTKEEMAYEGGKCNLIAVSKRHRDIFYDWARGHTHNIIWLDVCAPIFEPFERTKVWFMMPGSYRHIRILSELKNKDMNGFERTTLEAYASKPPAAPPLPAGGKE